LNDEPESCYSEPSILNIVVGIFLIIGTIASYIPQYIVIVSRKSSDGLSFIMIGIALTSSFFTAINAGILNWSNVVCCVDENLTFGRCLKNNLATEQLLIAVICTFTLYVFFLIYFHTEPTSTQSRRQRVRMKRIATVLFCTILFVSTGLAILAALLYYDAGVDSHRIASFAKALGIISAIMILVQWAPQIFTTWRMQTAGSLSISMLLLQVPGSLLVIFFQGILNKADITTWGPYVFGAIEQMILIVMLTFFWLREKRRTRRRNRRAREEEANRLIEPVINDYGTYQDI